MLDRRNHDRIDEAREAARILMGHRKPDRQLAKPLQTLARLGHETLLHMDMLSLITCQRDVVVEVTYARPDTPHIVQTYVHGFMDIPVLLPLDDEPEPFQRKSSPLAITRHGSQITGAEHDARALVQMQGLRGHRVSDTAFVILPKLFGFAAHWFNEIEGDMVRLQGAVSRPGRRPTFRSAHVMSAEGNA